MSNKTSDKNVANIEENIKTIKNLLQMLENGFLTEEMCPIRSWDPVPKYASALKYILAEREEMLKEREKYTIRLTDEEYRKVIENAQMDTSNDKVIALKFVVMQQQINEKDKRIQELEKELENNIPKQVVIDKIDELKLSGGSDGKDNVENLVRELTIDILQELLEGEK